VGTHSGRASVQCFDWLTGSHAPLLEPILDAPASSVSINRFAVASQMRSHAGAWERENRFAVASQMRSHAGAWEREKKFVHFLIRCTIINKLHKISEHVACS